MGKAHSVSEIPATMHMKIWRGSVLLFLGGSDLLVSLSVSNRQFFSKWVFPNVVLNSYPFCVRLHANAFRLPSRSVLLGKGQGDKGDTQQGDMSHQQSSWSGGTFHFQAASSSLLPDFSQCVHSYEKFSWMATNHVDGVLFLEQFVSLISILQLISVVLAGRASRVRDLIHFFTTHTLQKSRPPFNFTQFLPKTWSENPNEVVVFHSVNLNRFLLQWSRLTPQQMLPHEKSTDRNNFSTKNQARKSMCQTILLMEEILYLLIDTLSHYFQMLQIHPKWYRISSINSTSPGVSCLWFNGC